MFSQGSVEIWFIILRHNPNQGNKAIAMILTCNRKMLIFMVWLKQDDAIPFLAGLEFNNINNTGICLAVGPWLGSLYHIGSILLQTQFKATSPTKTVQCKSTDVSQRNRHCS